MLKIYLDAPEANDSGTPINIAAALIELETGNCKNEVMFQAGIDNLDEIADHIKAYTRRQRYRKPEVF